MSLDKRTFRSGFSVLEIVVATAVGSLVLYFGGIFFQSFSKNNSELLDRVSKESVRNLIRTSVDCTNTMAAVTVWTPGAPASLQGKAKPVILSPLQETTAGQVRALLSAKPGEFQVEVRKTAAAEWRPLFQIPLACN